MDEHKTQTVPEGDYVNILVIGGGISGERDVSLRSSKAVYDALMTNGHDAYLYDWDGSEEWLREHSESYDQVFPILHGVGGEDGTIQKILEDLKVRYLGTDKVHSILCMDKQKTRDILTEHSILIPIGEVVTFDQYRNHDLYNKPHVLKPVDGGSSIDTFIYPDITRREIDEVEKLFAKEKTYLLEAYISGIETTVPVLDGKVMPVIEIIPPQNELFDYENKYNGKTAELCPPKNVDIAVQKQMQSLALSVHEIMGCRHLSRTDMILSDNKIYVLEINTMPGLTSQSLFPLSARTAGMTFEELVDHMVTIVGKGN